MKNKSIIAVMLAVALWVGMTPEAACQVKLTSNIEINSDFHDFGDLVLGSGPVSCEFTLRNTGAKPVAILSVVTSCGCTDVDWTKEPLKPGATGKISATYSNAEAPLPFDKNLTVYLSDSGKPVLLHLRGVCHEKPLTPEEIFTHRFGPLGFRSLEVKSGNVLQGECRSDNFTVANLSSEPIKVEFTDVSEGLEIKIDPETIPAGDQARVSYTVRTSRKRWGKNWYYATPVVDGRSSFSLAGLPEGVKAGKLRIYAFTTDNFTSLEDDEKSSGPRPVFKTSTYSFGKAKKGKTIDAEFTFTNEGKRPFCVYKCDADAPKYSHGTIPCTEPGETTTIRFHLDTALLPKGETLVIVTLTTNSPLRPVINLFVSGYLE